MTSEGQQSAAPVSTASEPVPPALPREERDLVDAVLGKERKATAEFVARYTDSVYGYVRQRLACPSSDDLRQGGA